MKREAEPSIVCLEPSRPLSSRQDEFLFSSPLPVYVCEWSRGVRIVCSLCVGLGGGEVWMVCVLRSMCPQAVTTRCKIERCVLNKTTRLAK